MVNNSIDVIITQEHIDCNKVRIPLEAELDLYKFDDISAFFTSLIQTAYESKGNYLKNRNLPFFSYMLSSRTISHREAETYLTRNESGEVMGLNVEQINKFPMHLDLKRKHKSSNKFLMDVSKIHFDKLNLLLNLAIGRYNNCTSIK